MWKYEAKNVVHKIELILNLKVSNYTIFSASFVTLALTSFDDCKNKLQTKGQLILGTTATFLVFVPNSRSKDMLCSSYKQTN